MSFRAFSPEKPDSLSFREACASTQGPGIQASRVMPWEGVDADCVWFDPNLDVMFLAQVHSWWEKSSVIPAQAGIQVF
jgi:hypothetical protein